MDIGWLGMYEVVQYDTTSNELTYFSCRPI